MKALVRNSDGLVIDTSSDKFPEMNVATWVDCPEDVQNGWTYLNNNFVNPEPTPEPIPAMDQLRSQRNLLLSETDWWCVSDRTATAEQLAYRQALRDLPSTATPALDENGQLTGVTWPTKPE